MCDVCVSANTVSVMLLFVQLISQKPAGIYCNIE